MYSDFYHVDEEHTKLSARSLVDITEGKQTIVKESQQRKAIFFKIVEQLLKNKASRRDGHIWCLKIT